MKSSSLNFTFSDPWTADSDEELYFVLKQDAEIYLKYGEIGEPIRFDNVSVSIDFGQFLEGDDNSKSFKPEDVKYFLPNSTSAEGQVLLSLMEDGQWELAKSLVLAFFVENEWISHPFFKNPVGGSNFRQPHVVRAYVRGLGLLTGARGYFGKAENLNEWRAFQRSISEAKKKVGYAKQSVSRSENLLAKSIQNANSEVRKLREDRRQIRSIAALGAKLVSSRVAKENRIWLNKYNETYEHFTKQLEYKAAVKLWESRSNKHKEKSDSARFWLIFIGVCFSVSLVFVAVFAGSFIAEAFFREVCESQNGLVQCREVFSPRGPLLVGSVILVSSLFLWMLRMLNKIYLSERHLSLDAQEKRAFAETYLALREDEHVDERHESIVLSAIFRSTPDGVVKEDTSTLDMTLASVIAQRLSR